MPIRITAAICTHNRAAYLPGAIESLLQQSLPSSDYEILVIDNCSTDETPAIAQRYLTAAGDVTLRSARAEPLGLSHARNLAVQMAAGEVIAFLDDDAIAAPQWLAALLDAYAAFPNAWAVGGRVEPLWLAQRPTWLTDQMLPHLAILNLGDSLRQLQKGEEVYGVNCSFRRGAFVELGLFRNDLGRKGRQLLGSEESEFQARILRSGRQVIYTPNAIVQHVLPATRLEQDYFVRLAFGKGQSAARRVATEQGTLPLWRPALHHLLAAGKATLIGLIRWPQAARKLQTRRVQAYAAGYWRETLSRLMGLGN